MISDMRTPLSQANYSTQARRWLVGVGIPLLSLGLALPAVAELGGDVTSVQNDQARMKATLKVTETQAYNVHEISAPEGTIVKEYVSPEGKVFGISWKGHFMPDLQGLLGSYFTQFSQATQAKQADHRARRMVSVQEPGLVVQNAGRMRSFAGRAYVPQLIPQGVSAEVIQ
jgi:hypothetical protein